MATIQIFLSTVSAEFRSYRDALRHDLDRPNVTVKVQEDFIATGTETLDMLDVYLKQCDAVIHLVGDMTGSMAQPQSVTVIRERYPDFDIRLPLTDFLQPGGPALPYTQWEAWLALYHRKPLIICVPKEGATRDPGYVSDDTQRAIQQAHLKRLETVERFPGIHFANADRLAVDVLRSHLQDILASAGVVKSANVGLIDFAQERMRHGEIIGREEAMSTVRGWIDGASRGWILIKGGPGTGKSAILVGILNQLEKEYVAESIPYHFLRRGQGNWNEPDAVVRNLTARLERISTSAEHITAEGQERLYALLVAVAGQYAANNRRLVLVVDGLDEAAASGTERVLGRFLPATLPENVFIICASRPNYPELGWLDQRSGLRTIDLDEPKWIADNRKVVDAYWRKRGPQLKPPLDIEVLEKAIAAAEGNMLHAVTLFDAFETNAQARDPNRIPIGFNALLEDLWVRLVELKDRDTSTRVIEGLGLLAIAGEPLPLSTLARLLTWKHPADITDFKRNALPFLLEETAEWHGGEARYRPFHESTREFLTSGDHMLPEVNREYHELLARRLAAWPPADGARELERGYAARFALFHLSAIADWSRVSELLGDLRYCVAAVEVVGPQLLLARITKLTTADKPPQLIERASVLQRVLRKESQFLETYPRELPNLVHNRLVCSGWDRDGICASFAGFDRGWGLVNRVALGDQIFILRGHTASVRSCDIDHRGRYGVSGGSDGNLRVWDLERGTALHVIRPDSQAKEWEIEFCAISSDGRHVLVASGPRMFTSSKASPRLQLWDIRDGQMLREFKRADGLVAVAFSGTDVALSCYDSGAIDLHDIAHNTSRQITLNTEIAKVAVDTSGTLVAAITDRGCGVWRLSDGVKVSNVSFDGGEFCSFGPDGKTIAVAQRGSAVIANAADGSILYRTEAIGDQVSDCRLLDGNRLLFTSDWDVQLVVWDMALDRAVVKYEGHTYTAECCAVTPDGRFALSGGGDNTVRLWSLTDKVIASSVDRHPNLVDGCTLNATATLACSAPQEDLPAIWDARTGTRLRSVETELRYGFVRFCSFENQSRLATLGQSLRLFDPETAELVWEKEIPVRDRYGEVALIDESTFQGAQHGAERGQIDLLPLLYAGSHVVVWQPTGELQTVKISGNEPRVSRLNSGQSLAVAHQKGLEIIDLDHNSRRRKIADGVKACVGSPRSNTVYALMLDGRLCRLDATDGKEQAVLGEVKQKEVRLYIDPQETTLWALCSPANKATYSEVDELLIAFSPQTPGIVQQFSIAGHRVFGICFLQSMMITAGWDSTLRVWDARQPVPVAAISGSAPFRCVDVAGDRLVAGDQKGNMWFLAPMNQLYP